MAGKDVLPYIRRLVDVKDVLLYQASGQHNPVVCTNHIYNTVCGLDLVIALHWMSICTGIPVSKTTLKTN